MFVRNLCYTNENIYMNENSFCCFTIFLVMTTIPATPMIYSVKFLVFNFLGVGFLAFNRGQRSEN